MRFHRSYLLAIPVLLASAPVSAQQQPALSHVVREGMRVRVTAPSVMRRRAGTVRSADTTGFLLAGFRPGDATWVPYAAIQTMEVSAGTRRAPYVFLGFLLGPVAGAAAGIGFCSLNDVENNPCLAPIGFGLAGFFVGPVLGALIAPERWRRLP